MPDLTARITEILRDHRFWHCNHASVGPQDHCRCGDRPWDVRQWDEHVSDLIAAEFRREERQIDYGLGSLGVEKRTQVRYVTSWETQ